MGRALEPYLEDPSSGHGAGSVDGGQQPAVPVVAVAGVSHFVGYGDCGNDRALWARRVAVQKLVGGGHSFVPADLDRSFADKTVGIRCHRCLVDFPASRLVKLSKLDSACTGDLFGLKPGPLGRPEERLPSLVGTGLRLKNLELDSSHCFRHFRGVVWCSVCAGLVNLLLECSKGGAPILSKLCKKAASSKPLSRALVLLHDGEAPGHLKGGWPGPANLSLRGFM